MNQVIVEKNRKIEEIKKALNTLRSHGEVVEVRMLKTARGTVSGYYDNYAKLSTDIYGYIGKNDIYFTLNPVKSELIARCKNRLGEYAKHTTNDEGIKKISWVLIDLDPKRPSGISSKHDEKQAALDLANEIIEYLKTKEIEEPILADSGNGYHILLKIELENNQENVEVLKRFLQALDFKFSNEKVEVDKTTFNPSRIVKLYGTKACKGDNTEDRPHRYSKIMRVPEEIKVNDIEVIKKIANKMPSIDKKVSNNRGINKGKINKSNVDIENFIEKNGLDLAFKVDFNGNGVKYILNTCPWNPEHTDRSAYIIQFENGAIAAGCHHNGCSKESWGTLKHLLGYKNTQIKVEQPEKEKDSDCIVRLASGGEFFKNDTEEPYAAFSIDNHWEVMDMKSNRFKSYLMKLYFDYKQSVPGSDALKQAIELLKAKAIFSDKEVALKRRINKLDDKNYYDLCSPVWNAVEITKEGCTIQANPPILFTRGRNMREQVEPDFLVSPQEIFDLVEKHFRFKKESDKILFTTYLVSCFIPEIQHTILILFGEKGAAKSTIMKMIKSIVDPAQQDLLSMPTSKQDLAVLLTNTYMPCFDNLEVVSKEKSNMLCMSATGGAFARRTLYTDSDETILSLKRCVVLNGINIVATQPDLLDRSILIELERIPDYERKTEKEIWESFNADKPKFLGAIFNTISRAMREYENINLTRLGRMADFTKWGCAIAKVIGIGEDEFLKCYINNQDTANDEVLSSNPIAASIIALMLNRCTWEGSVTEFLSTLERVAQRENIYILQNTWANNANVLSRRLNEIKSNLESIGIFFEIRNAGQYKKLTIRKENTENVTPSLEINTGETFELDIDEVLREDTESLA